MKWEKKADDMYKFIYVEILKFSVRRIVNS